MRRPVLRFALWGTWLKASESVDVTIIDPDTALPDHVSILISDADTGGQVSCLVCD